MTLAENAFTIASHLSLFIIGVMVAVRIVMVVSRGRFEFLNLFDLVCAWLLCLSMFGIERLYYVVARWVAPLGIDLWRAHPAPEILAILVAIGVYATGVPFSRAVLTRSAVLRRGGRDFLILGAIYLVIVVTLR
ncbi:MAG: hypothetical protein AAF618_00830 [Pseudomonadota bacterium]